MEEAKILDILVQENYIEAADAHKAADFSASHRGASVLTFLLSEGLINKGLLGQAIAESFKLPYVDFSIRPPTKENVNKLPEQLAKKYCAVVLEEKPKSVVVATAQPDQIGLQDELQKIFPSKKVAFAYTLKSDIIESFSAYRKQLDTRFGEIIKAGGKIAPEIIDQILEDAILLKASDIHFEPQEEVVVVRFRVDGVLQEGGRIDKQYYENMVNRVKVQAKLRIDEHQTAQDGAIRFFKNGLAADLRISIVPTMDGEKIVIRLLAAYVRDIELSGLGLLADDEERLLAAARKPFGMILVVGPTGSGKTTTLYSLVKTLASSQVNVTTIEDPVEYKISGINQIQVNNQTNLTFAKGLRSIARQDPDVILVGEIRDLETAEIAVNAALTGHLLLSTFHANDAVSAIPRLLDMGIEPFLLASTLDIIVAQRLIRKICDSCRVSKQYTSSEIVKKYPAVAPYCKQKNITLYEGKGCSACAGTGYRGRVGVYELLQMNTLLQDAIVSNPASNTLFTIARSQGFTTMWDDGFKKVKGGLSSLEELIRVVQPK